MSSFTVLGYFGLAEGRFASVPAQVVGGKPTTYAHYTSSFACSDKSSAPVDIRLFSPSSKPLCPDNTIALIFANAYIPSSANLPILLDAIHFFPIPGNPADSFAYEATVPDFPYPIIFALGHVASNLSNTLPKMFSISVSSYVRGMAQESTIQCVFSNQKRWAKVPTLTPNSCIYASGVSSSISLDGVLSFSVDSISISLGPRNSPTPVMTSPTAGPSVRKFNPFAGRVGPQSSPVSAEQSNSTTTVAPIAPASTSIDGAFENLIPFDPEPAASDVALPSAEADAVQSPTPTKRRKLPPKPRAPPKSRNSATRTRKLTTAKAAPLIGEPIIDLATTPISSDSAGCADGPSITSETSDEPLTIPDSGAAPDNKGKQRAV
ncbi:hypothetical protein BDN70DRAFT_994810 [Pholiota conissans]|uniref:Uncharacterized protein n=1 Tax=Pholiota conissans TaxID=109636 RepID=A0A9P5Z028_9AGAR|nr:hypothetical protein BDN70DRAFT_994810 [Pholiota conissans]